MKKSSVKKLQLNRETLCALEQLQLKEIVGASMGCGTASVAGSGCHTRCTCTTALC
jgi:hypothetical protein